MSARDRPRRPLTRPPAPKPGEPTAHRRAAALSYSGGTAPTVVAAGSGHVADKIVQTANERGVPVQQDGPLADALARLPVDTEIPPELYRAVAEVLIWAHGVDIVARHARASGQS